LQEPGKHLSIEELEQLANLAEAPPAVADLEPARQHLAECAHCQRQVELLQQTDRSLHALRTSVPASRTAACPDEQEWLRLAAGLLRSDEQQARLGHAATCDHCGSLLRQASEDFADELAPEEESLLHSLSTAQPEASRSLAERLAQTRETPRETTRGAQESRAAVRGVRDVRETPREAKPSVRRWFAWPALNYAAAAVAVVIAAALAFWPTPRPATQEAEQLLAQAYTEQRIMELRIPGASHAPVRVERGPERSRLSRPPALLEAEALIARQLRNNPNDANWWHMRGRAELLDWKYDAAIKSLKRALDSQPESSPIKIDLATAYFQRAEAEDRAIDYGMTIELLGQVLARNPNDPVALYNRAVAEERMFLYNQSIADWEHYLRVDPQGTWAEEVREKLDVLRKKLKAHEQSLQQPLASPQEFVQQAQGGDATRLAKLDARIEEYLEQALRQWMPVAFPVNPQRADPQQMQVTRDALQALAGLLSTKHSDRWLGDMLASSSAPTFPHAVQALANALDASAAGNPDATFAEATRAERLFREGLVTAGALRARLEQVYAKHRSIQGQACADDANQLSRELLGKGYAWAEVQLHLEWSTCSKMVARLRMAHEQLQQGLRASRRYGYGSLEMRSLYLAAELESNSGNREAAWSSSHTGLQRYWGGRFPLLRAYQFYGELGFLADDAQQWSRSVVFWREAVSVIARTENRWAEAVARHLLGSAAIRSGAHEEAREEFAKSQVLFSGLAQNDVLRIYRMDGQIYQAELATQNGSLDAALAILNEVQPTLLQISDRLILLHYYEALGTLHVRRRSYEQAEQAFATAIRLSGLGLSDLRDARERAMWMLAAARIHRGLVQARLQQGDRVGALTAWKQFRTSAFSGPSTSVGPFSGTGLREILISRTAIPQTDWKQAPSSLKHATVLSFAQFPDGVAVWLYDNRGIQFAWIAVRTVELTRKATRFAEECSRKETNAAMVKQAARQLYDLVIAPVASYLEPNRTLIIEPDGAISSIPLGALQDPSGQYLSDRFVMVWSSGVAYTQPFRDPPITLAQRALIVGGSAPGPDGSLPPLPDALVEASSVADRFPNATRLIGRRATFEAVRRALPTAEVFHFAGHAISNRERGGLLLEGGDSEKHSETILGSEQVRQLRLPRMRLAVFSACSTAAGEREGVSDPEGLVRSFQAAGVPNVVASRWNVDSRVTAAFMSEFYSALSSGQSVAQALRTASTLIRGRPETSHPYYWAAFQAYGHV
jgi:CHAT domain-containing protein/tetratricopeptide (TPR) repeat protein